MSSLRQRLDAWAEVLRADWAEHCNIVDEMLVQHDKGCEADLSSFVSSHLSKTLPEIELRVEAAVYVCADGRKAKTNGRVDVACYDRVSQEVVVIELKRHALAACSATESVDDFVARVSSHDGDLVQIGMARLRACNTTDLSIHAASIAEGFDRTLILHAVFSGSANVLHGVQKVLRFQNRTFVVRTAEGVLSSAYDQAENYARSIRADGFHPNAHLYCKIKTVEAMALIALGESLFHRWVR